MTKNEDYYYHELQKLEFQLQEMEEKLSDRDEKIEELQEELERYQKLKPLLPFLLTELRDFLHYQKHPTMGNEGVQQVVYRTMSNNIQEALSSIEEAI